MAAILNRKLSVVVLLSILFILLIQWIYSPLPSIQTIKSTAHHIAFPAQSNSNPAFTDTISHLFDTIRHPVTAPNYTDSKGHVFDISGTPTWTKPLRNEILIVDIDTREPTGDNEIFNQEKIDWEKLESQGGQLVSEAITNHYLYAKIHGYDYKFYRAHSITDHYNTWVKVHAISELLHEYRFVVFIDADALIHHMEVPMEWMFNRWNITNHTSIALPLDVMEGNECMSCDSKGNRVLNTGFVIAQQLPHTFEMFDAWKSCTDEKRYPGCGQWKTNWSHEQRAFSEYIRYDFNPHHNIVEIDCDDAMGYPDQPEHITTTCTGQFVRHYTPDKDRAKASLSNSVMQSITEVLQKELVSNKNQVWQDASWPEPKPKEEPKDEENEEKQEEKEDQPESSKVDPDAPRIPENVDNAVAVQDEVVHTDSKQGTNYTQLHDGKPDRIPSGKIGDDADNKTDNDQSSEEDWESAEMTFS